MAIGRINGVAALTVISYKKMSGRFAGEKSGCNNEVTLRQGFTFAVITVISGFTYNRAKVLILLCTDPFASFACLFNQNYI